MTRSDIKPLQSFFRIPSIWDEDELSFFQQNKGIEVYETDNEIVVKAQVPGVKPEEIDVQFEDGVLRVTGRHEEAEEEKKKKKVVYQAHRSTSFNYSTSLPRLIDPAKMNAEVEHGVITITAPLAEAVKPKKIAVKAK